MKPSDALRINRAAIRQVVNAHRASNVRVFGSAAHGDDTDSSGVIVKSGVQEPESSGDLV